MRGSDKTNGSARWLALASSLLLAVTVASQARAQLSSPEMASLKGMEEKLFFKNYEDSEKPEARITRIEKRIFGDAGEGTLNERLSKLSTLVKPDEKKPEPRPAQNQTPASRPQQNNNNRQTQPVYQQADTAPDPEDIKRRVRLAKEEEVAQLQSEAVELWKARRGNEALEKFEQVVRIAPDFAEAHFSLGVIYEAKQDYASALTSYQRALDLSPGKKEYVEAVNLLSKKAQVSEVNQEKKQELKQLSEQASGAYRSGQYQSALQLYKEMNKKAPKEALVKYNIGTIYLALKNPVDALSYFKQALKLKPDEARYQDAVQKLSASMDQDNKAREQAEGAWNQGNDKPTKKPKEQKNRGNRVESTQSFQNSTPADFSQVGNYRQNQQMQPMQQMGGQQMRQMQPMQQMGNQQMQMQPMQQMGNQQMQQMQPMQQMGNQQMQQMQPMQQVGNQQMQMQPMQQMGGQQMGGQRGGGGGSQASAAFGIIAKDGPGGAEITSLGAASKALRAGLSRGDIVRAVDGVMINSANDLNQVLSRKQPNEAAQFIIQRNGKIGQFVLSD